MTGAINQAIKDDLGQCNVGAGLQATVQVFITHSANVFLLEPATHPSTMVRDHVSWDWKYFVIFVKFGSVFWKFGSVFSPSIQMIIIICHLINTSTFGLNRNLICIFLPHSWTGNGQSFGFPSFHFQKCASKVYLGLYHAFQQYKVCESY